MLFNTAALAGRCCVSKMSLKIISVLCNVIQCRKVFPMSAQLRYDVRLVLILTATNNHQTIVYSGGYSGVEEVIRKSTYETE